MTDNITITPMTDEYIEAFHAVLDLVSQERKYLSFLEAPPLEKTRAFIHSMREENNPQLMALDNGKLVGWCDISRESKEVFKHCGGLGIAILPEYREKGIGRRLMQATIDAAFERGMTRIELEVYERNHRARFLYQKLGFEIEGIKRKGLYLNGEYQDIYCMALLAPSLREVRK